MTRCCPNCGYIADRPKLWTSVDRMFVDKNRDMTAAQLAEILGRTVASIYTFCQRNGIKLTHKSSKLGIKC